MSVLCLLSTARLNTGLAAHLYAKPMMTTPMYGLRNVYASSMWEASVATMPTMHHMRLRPVLSTRYPNAGDATAEMTYTRLQQQTVGEGGVRRRNESVWCNTVQCHTSLRLCVCARVCACARHK